MLLRRDLEAADARIDGRTLTLAMVPFNRAAWVSDDGVTRYREAFAPGAFKHLLNAPNRVELRYDHRQEGLPYGFGTALREDSDYLIGEFRVAPSEAGDQALALVRDDQLRGVSIGFFPGVNRDAKDDDGPLTLRVRVSQMPEVSLVSSAVYPGAEVLALRHQRDVDTNVLAEQERVFWMRRRATLL